MRGLRQTSRRREPVQGMRQGLGETPRMAPEGRHASPPADRLQTSHHPRTLATPRQQGIRGPAGQRSRPSPVLRSGNAPATHRRHARRQTDRPRPIRPAPHPHAMGRHHPPAAAPHARPRTTRHGRRPIRRPDPPIGKGRNRHHARRRAPSCRRMPQLPEHEGGRRRADTHADLRRPLRAVYGVPRMRRMARLEARAVGVPAQRGAHAHHAHAGRRRPMGAGEHGCERDGQGLGELAQPGKMPSTRRIDRHYWEWNIMDLLACAQDRAERDGGDV